MKGMALMLLKVSNNSIGIIGKTGVIVMINGKKAKPIGCIFRNI